MSGPMYFKRMLFQDPLHLSKSIHALRTAGCPRGANPLPIWINMPPQRSPLPRAAFPSGCLAAQTKRWAEPILKAVFSPC